MKQILSYIEGQLANKEVRSLVLKGMSHQFTEDHFVHEKNIFNLVKNDSIQEHLKTIITDTDNAESNVNEFLDYFVNIPSNKAYGAEYGFTFRRISETDLDYIERYATTVLLSILVADLASKVETNREKAQILFFMRFIANIDKPIRLYEPFGHGYWLFEKLRSFTKDVDVHNLENYFQL